MIKNNIERIRIDKHNAYHLVKKKKTQAFFCEDTIILLRKPEKFKVTTENYKSILTARAI